MIWLLAFCGWISVLAPMPFTVWYYIIGDGTRFAFYMNLYVIFRSLNQSVVMCHLFRTTMEAVPHTMDTMMTLFSVLLAAAR